MFSKFKLSPRRLILSTLLTATIIGGFMPDAKGQTPAPVPEESPEIKALKEEKDKLTLESEVLALKLAVATTNASMIEQENNLAMNKQKAITDLLPTTSTTGKEGAITVAAGGGYLVKMLATSSLEHVGDEIANSLKKAKIKVEDKVILYAGIDLQTLAGKYHAVDVQLSAVDPILDKLITTTQNAKQYVDQAFDPSTESAIAAASTALIAAPKLLGAVADITKFFRTDTTITNVEVTGDEDALKTAVAAALLRATFTKVSDPKNSLNMETNLGNKYKSLVAKVAELRENTNKIGTEFDREIDKLARELSKDESRLKALKAKKEADLTAAEKAELASLPSEIDLIKEKIAILKQTKTDRIAGLTANTTTADALAKAIVTNGNGGPSPLSELRIYDQIFTDMDDSKAILLNLKIVHTGGEYLIRKGIFVTDRISYIGSATVRYEVFDKDGMYKLAGIETQSLQSTTNYKDGFQGMQAERVQ